MFSSYITKLNNSTPIAKNLDVLTYKPEECVKQRVNAYGQIIKFLCNFCDLFRNFSAASICSVDWGGQTANWSTNQVLSNVFSYFTLRIAFQFSTACIKATYVCKEVDAPMWHMGPGLINDIGLG